MHGQFPSSEFQRQWEMQWNDPVFVDSFIGSYEPLKDVEPQFEKKDEINLIRDLRELFQANPRAAAARLQQEIDSDPSAPYLYLLATLYLTTQDTDKARLYYDQAIKKFPDYRRAHKNIAFVYLQEQDLDNAKVHIHRAIELGEKDGRLYGLLGYIYLNEENYLASESAYREAVIMQPDDLNWKLGLAQTLLGMTQYEEANALLQTLIEEDPNNKDFWLLQVNTYLGMEEPARAIANLEILRRMGTITDPSLKLLGDIYMNEKMYDQAISTYTVLMEKDSEAKYLDACIRLGTMLSQVQQFDHALTVLNRIETDYQSVSDKDTLAILNLKARIARATGDGELAKETLESIIARDPLNGDALLELAAYHEGQDEIEEALFFYGQAGKIKDFETTALVRHAQLLVRQKNYADAVPLLKRSLTINDDPRIARFLEDVERAANNS
ncbi:MAG: tetratricopeptide repeat protein [Verrucomicrobiota bacterium]